jgi:hypothetical protein
MLPPIGLPGDVGLNRIEILGMIPLGKEVHMFTGEMTTASAVPEKGRDVDRVPTGKTQPGRRTDRAPVPEPVPAPAFDYRALSPFRGADWRWVAAAEDHASGVRPGKQTDPVVRRLVVQLRWARRRGKAAADKRWPVLAAAWNIHSGGGVVSDELKARLLAGQAFNAIAQVTGVPATVVAEYEAVFFHVAHVLRATWWLLDKVVRIRPGQPVTEGQTWQYLALAGGIGMVDLMTGDFLGRTGQDPESNKMAAKGRYLVRMEATNSHDIPEARAIFEEGCRLFSNVQGNPNGTREEQFLALYLDAMRMDLGLPSEKQSTTEPQLDSRSRTTTCKENSHA